MNCKCCILFLNNKKYLVKCIECKNIPDETTNKTKYKFNWYEKHIELIRDYPDFRICVELILLIGFLLFAIMCWIDMIKKTYLIEKPFHIIIRSILIIWTIISYTYLVTIQKLKNNQKYFISL